MQRRSGAITAYLVPTRRHGPMLTHRLPPPIPISERLWRKIRTIVERVRLLATNVRGNRINLQLPTLATNRRHGPMLTHRLLPPIPVSKRLSLEVRMLARRVRLLATSIRGDRITLQSSTLQNLSDSLDRLESTREGSVPQTTKRGGVSIP